MGLSKQEMESSKQENGVISPTSRPQMKKFFYNILFICSKVFKSDFQNRKWNYPNRKWNYFSHLIKKKFFTKCCSFVPRGSKLISTTGNGMIQTGNGIISPISGPLMKKLLLQNVSHLIKGVQINFQNRKWN